jgi:threonine-phosphate decarboxylase
MIEHLPLHGGQLRHISEHFDIPISQLMDFSANINPDGPPPAVLSTLRASLEDLSVLTAYPDLEQTGLKHSIADYAGVRAQNIAVANGFIPLLESALRALKVKRCLLPLPAFVEYRRTLSQAGVEIRPHVLTSAFDFCYDIDALVDGDHDAVLLANPQNPSGVLTNKGVLLQLVAKCAERNIKVLLDEAFIDYMPFESLSCDIDRSTNLVVFRSVTKFHGIPGLRVAYAVATEAVARKINDNLPPWPISTLAAHAVAAALGDESFKDRTRLHNGQRRTSLEAGLQRIGIHTYPAAANFLLLRLPKGVSADLFWQRMILEHRIVVRSCSNYEALSTGHVRAAVRTERENEHLVSAAFASLSRW